MVVNNIINSFMEFGYSEYEAKAYCALLTINPSTAYEIAKYSLIPTSKIYEILSRLLEKGLLLEYVENNKKKYIPIDPDEFIDKQHNKTHDILDDLSKTLNNIKKEKDISYIWNIKDYNNLIDRAKKIIIEAKKTLLISIWKDEVNVLKDLLKNSYKNKIQISIVHFGDPEISFGQVYKHPIENTLYSEKGGRAIVIVSDSQEALMGTIYKNNQADGAYSKNKGFVMMAEDYLKHDVYIMKIVRRFDNELIKKFGTNYNLLRDIYTDKEVL